VGKLEPVALTAVSQPIDAVLLDYGHTLIYFDERPHSALVDAYEKVNQLLATAVEREIPAAQVLIERVSRVVDDEIQRDNAAGRPRLMTQQLAALGLLSSFDGVTFSSEVGVRKPHPEIFTDALRKVGVDAGRAVFVGDRVREDVQGPQRLGMRAVLTREWR